jgi:hypothetical protein
VASKIRSRLRPNDDRRLKKLTYQLKFLREESLERNEFLQLYQLELREAIAAYLKELGVDVVTDGNQPPPEQNSVLNLADQAQLPTGPEADVDEPDETDDDEDIRELRDLYRKIVVLTHPDKVRHMEALAPQEKQDRLHIYRQACIAFDLRRMDDLVELAIYLGIDVDVPMSIKIKRMQNQIDRVTADIEAISKTVEWVWGENFGNVSTRAQILGAVCREMGLVDQDENVLLEFIGRYDSDELRSERRKVGTRPEKRDPGVTPKRRQ